MNWREISDAAGIPLRGETARAVSGGSISTAYRVESSDAPVFIKLEPARNADRLEAEADGLAALAATATLRVPAVLACDLAGQESGTAFLIIEWISSGRSAGAAALLGSGLAALHGAQASNFGWHRDNYIGSTPQPNARTDSWAEFLREHRLGFQF
ncbi:MAG: phosphotransferase, partial [Gammaproteobacteria bacterium]|nr:phosphotransferase [Gammaproteobacteria bacterium]